MASPKPHDFFSAEPFPVIVYSQRRWDGLWGRGQQLFSRLSQRHPVLYVEPPLFADSHESWRAPYKAKKCHDVTVLQAYYPAAREHTTMWLEGEQRRVMQAAMYFAFNNKFKGGVRCFDNPAMFNIYNIPGDKNVTIYNCRHEPTRIRDISYQTERRERELLERSDLVLAASPSLQREKSILADNSHVLFAGVDAAHFGGALQAETPVPPDIAHLSGPVLGYFGAIDERLDLELLEKIADTNPTWNLLMIGPIERLEEYEIPQRENIHWIGQREYSQLPAYAKRFDACLLPFAINEATQVLCPAKTLEYLATGKPVVAMALPEVQAAFGDLILFANSGDEFLAQCQTAISQPDEKRLQRGLARAAASSWDDAAHELERLIDRAIFHQHRHPVRQVPLRPITASHGIFMS